MWLTLTTFPLLVRYTLSRNYSKLNVFMHFVLYLVLSIFFTFFPESLPGPSGVKEHMINYYQWVTLFLLVQAVMFVTPKLIWKFISCDTGYYISGVVQQLRDVSTKLETTDQRKSAIDNLIIYTDRYVYLSLKLIFATYTARSWEK